MVVKGRLRWRAQAPSESNTVNPVVPVRNSVMPMAQDAVQKPGGRHKLLPITHSNKVRDKGIDPRACDARIVVCAGFTCRGGGESKKHFVTRVLAREVPMHHHVVVIVIEPLLVKRDVGYPG